MSLIVVTAPTAEPVTTEEAKQHARVDGAVDDAYLDALVKAARGHVETVTGRALVTRTYDWTLEGFPGCGDGHGFRVPRPPLRSVTSITYIDTAGASQVLATSVFEALSAAGTGADDAAPEFTPGRIVLKPDQSWPDVQSGRAAPVTVRLVAGYGGAGRVPQTLKHAVLVLVAHWYAAREPIVTGTIVAKVPDQLDALVESYRMRGFGG